MTLKKKILIAIDNGHGYNTAGKRAPDGSMREWEFNHAAALYLKAELEKCGFEVVLVSDTREDTPLATRVKRAEAAKADFFISIHANAYLNKWGSHGGIETYAYKAGCTGDKLAKEVQAALIAATKLRNRGVKYDSLYVVRESTMPAILVECGFMDNRDELALLKSDAYRRKCAQAIAKGVCKHTGVAYVNNTTGTNTPTTDKGEVFWRVVCGSFKDKSTAEKRKKELESKGFDGVFLTQYTKE